MPNKDNPPRFSFACKNYPITERKINNNSTGKTKDDCNSIVNGKSLGKKAKHADIDSGSDSTHKQVLEKLDFSFSGAAL